MIDHTKGKKYATDSYVPWMGFASRSPHPCRPGRVLVPKAIRVSALRMQNWDGMPRLQLSYRVIICTQDEENRQTEEPID